MKKLLILLALIICSLFIFISCEQECRHENMSESISEPTCTESGHTNHTCTDCGYTYTDKIIEPTGHILNHKIIPADCTNDGYTEYSCACGYTYISDIISAVGHKYVDNIKPSDCVNIGYTEHTCSICDYSYISNHIDPTGHELNKTVIAPDCETEGYTLFSCKRCDHSYKNNYTSPKGHELESTVTAPTCTETGYTRFSCNSCDFSYVSDYVAVLSHQISSTQVEPECESEGYTLHKCENCDYSYKNNFIPPKGHIYVGETVSASSCTEGGEEKYSCTCGESYSVFTPPHGHETSRLVTMPTLSDMGYTQFSCTRCDYDYIGEYRFYSDILKDAYAVSDEVLAKGIDVSYHQYKKDSNDKYISLDWQAIKESGVNYVIIRIADTSVGIDPTFEMSYNDAKAAGLDIGFYLYTNATSVAEIRLEANLALSALAGKQFEYPVYLDLEAEALKTIDPAILNEMCVEFFTTLQRSGYYTGLYVNHDWLYTVIDTETALSRFDIWYARYPDAEEHVWNTDENGMPFGMWQYTDEGYIGETKFDFNFAYKDYPSLIKSGGFNGYDSDVKFPDTEKSFVWITYESGDIKVRSKNDYFTSEGYDSSLDVIGYVGYGERFEVLEQNDKYTVIKYNGETAYITANPDYISFTGIYTA